MFRKTLLLALVTLALLCASTDARKTSSGRSRGSSSRGTSSRRTNYNPQPAPTSFSNPAQSAGSSGTSLFGWQTKAKETPVQRTQTGVSHQSRAAQPSHSYPSSQTGLSGNQQPPSYQQAVQQNHAYPQNSKPQQAHTYPQSNSNPVQSNPQSHAYPAQNSQGQRHTYPGQNAQNNAQSNTQSHAYPASGGLSGHSGVGSSNPAAPGGGYGASAPAYPGGQARPPVSGSYPVGGSHSYGNNYHQGQPPPYSGPGYSNVGYGQPGFGHGGYGGGGYGGYGGHGGYGSGFGGYNYGGMSRGTSTLSKVGIAGAGVGTLLTGLALWNLARSGSKGNTYIYQDHRGNPIPVPANATAPAVDPILGELVNCTLTISGANATEVIGIPCAIATSFSPNSDLNTGVDKSTGTQEAKCTITVVTKNNTEFSTTIPCSIFLNTAKEANVTEPPPLAANATDVLPGAAGEMPSMGANGTEFAGPVGVPLAPLPGQNGPVFTGPPLTAPIVPLSGSEVYPNQGNFTPTNLNHSGSSAAHTVPACNLEPGSTPDPLNPCVPSTGDLSVIPLANSTAAAA